MHPAILVGMSEVMTAGFVYGVFRMAATTAAMQTSYESLMKKIRLRDYAINANF
ncbi:hypothetical protein KZJ38_30645 [Paraburkholderia edwinii]|uniref:ABC transmembrane type-1 domain-containing protein n=1 Tax=Paraburkholderia edwinii TaxID=2861782 RepID=A0ABX8URX9_9BURK|nr:hypothetical protein [Paraburkholderia edwinii]QYD71386.1 hypothetical protein KZJ38_30645 [Paraburkholderia edwinii]